MKETQLATDVVKLYRLFCQQKSDIKVGQMEYCRKQKGDAVSA